MPNLSNNKRQKIIAAALICAMLTMSLTVPKYRRSDLSAVNTEAKPVSSSIQPSVVNKPDAASYSTKKICWGQGVNFDDQNRPQDAVNAQSKYGSFGADFIDTSGEKVIYLTFDEGYENGYTAKILDTLKQKNVKATFFVTGDYAKGESELMKRMIAEGHTVGNHTWRHYSMPEKDIATCKDELKQLHDYVSEKYNYNMTVMRPPKGEFSEQTLALTKDMGYKTMLWSFAYKDWEANKQGDCAASLKKLNDRLHPGAIYLLHAVSPTNAEILGDFIDSAQSQGYKFVIPS